MRNNKIIRLLVMDVDGCLTDGNIYMSHDGEMMKQFNVKDGYGIRHILNEAEIIPVIITGRKSAILVKRCEELCIKELIQGSEDKLDSLINVMERYDVGFDEVAAIGDDIPDIAILEKVGLSGCPVDAVTQVKDLVDYVSPVPGGRGAVRDFIEWLVKTDIAN